MFGLVDFFDSAIPCRGNKPIKIGISTFIAERILPHHPDSENPHLNSTHHKHKAMNAGFFFYLIVRSFLFGSYADFQV